MTNYKLKSTFFCYGVQGGIPEPTSLVCITDAKNALRRDTPVPQYDVLFIHYGK